jgi:2-polyprenyl-6-methoxyphenol hydroxylase-like FAD-dependent oxidoreductase
MGFHSAVFTAAHTYGLDRTGLMYSVPGRSATILGAATGLPAKVMLDFAAPPQAVDHRDVEAQRALVAGAFEGLGWHVPSLLEAMWRAPDFSFDSAAQVVMDRYATGRVALLGDAGFGPGPGGMGTGLAVVGAYVLAGELAVAGGDHESAFAAYERRLRPYAEVCAGQARGGEGFLVPSRRSQIWMRNQTMRVLTRLPGKGLIRKLTAKAANAIDLPDYRPYGLSRTG